MSFGRVIYYQSSRMLTAATTSLRAIPTTTTAGDLALLAGADAGFAEGTTQSGDVTELVDMNAWDTDTARLVAWCKGDVTPAQEAATVTTARNLAGRLAALEARHGIDQVQADASRIGSCGRAQIIRYCARWQPEDRRIMSPVAPLSLAYAFTCPNYLPAVSCAVHWPRIRKTPRVGAPSVRAGRNTRRSSTRSCAPGRVKSYPFAGMTRLSRSSG
jgi:hypothetical protein